MVGAERVAGRVVVDGFCGVGGSTVHFARRCPHVIGVDRQEIPLKQSAL